MYELRGALAVADDEVGEPLAECREGLGEGEGVEGGEGGEGGAGGGAVGEEGDGVVGGGVAVDGDCVEGVGHGGGE